MSESGVQRFRKKPVEVEAVQYTPESRYDVIQWMTEHGLEPQHQSADEDGAIYDLARLGIHTLEGTMTADLDDWIIKGVAGEFYPCKPEIFAATYEPVEANPNQSKGGVDA